MSTKTNDLKQEIKGILLDSKEKERIARVAANASLKTITFFCNEKNPSCKTYRDYLKQEGIKFNEKEMDKPTATIVGAFVSPVVSVNGVNLVVNRDFKTPTDLGRILIHIAHRDYIHPPFEIRIEESLKNNFNRLSQQILNLHRQITPITKMISSIAQEEAAEKRKDEQKNK